MVNNDCLRWGMKYVIKKKENRRLIICKNDFCLLLLFVLYILINFIYWLFFVYFVIDMWIGDFVK